MNKLSGPETGILSDKPHAFKSDWRFERCTRLLGAAAMDKLASSHVAVIVTKSL